MSKKSEWDTRVLFAFTIKKNNQNGEELYVKNTGSKGRGLYAKKTFSQGDQIFIEKPIIASQFSWNALYKYIACDYCLKSLETAHEMAERLSGNRGLELPHLECCETLKTKSLITSCPACQILYCCEECRLEAATKYHRALCLESAGMNDPDHPLRKLEDAWRNIHYPPETASINLICKMIASVMQADNPDDLIQRYSSFCNSPVNDLDQIAHKLLGENFADQLEMLRVMLTDALYNEQLEQWYTNDGFRSLIALIGMNGQGIGTSALSEYVHNIDALNIDDDERKIVDGVIDQLYEDIDKESGQFLNCEGSGLYQLQSCCNHSCNPNSEVTFPFNNSTLVLVAMEDIQIDEEICISYLDDCERGRSRHSRQKYLRENYLFQCTCSLCESQADAPDETSSEESDDSTDS